ncbi:MAG TPA: carboxypeptidase-like regulatory domain-containing protein [Flavobacterium sp.]|uniref:carboxypeptidase-like regulatory domain-containing protein n=2 Tax=Flavobacterium TaxID=237 RepID=UPI0025BFB799|nr:MULTISPECIES: carboxypeptidase-like regulatory domain-containing protein [unclassified Flavobacterium]HRE78379.1 carboxypeptidase-like regulatory domain-containing protein [Flavobacterium sp.]
MKKIYLFLFALIALSSTAQSLVFEGKIVDKTTQESIPFTNIFVQNSTQGVISNEDGIFKFYIPNGAKNIEVGHIGYKTQIFSVTEIKAEPITIQLETDEMALEEVIVTNKPINQILAGILSNSKNQLDKSIKLETYYREFVKINDKYSKFSDGVIDFYIQPKKKEKIESKLVVNQSRAFQLAGIDEIEKKGKADLSEMDSFFDIQKAANGFFTYEYIDRISSDKANESYDFELRSKKDQNGNTLEVIYIKPKPNVAKALLTGKIIYDPIQKVVLDIDIKMSENHKQHVETINALIMKFAVHDIQIKQTYKYSNDKYIPSYRKSIIDIHIKFGKQMNDRMMCVSDLVVTDFTDDVSSLPEKNKIFKERNLYSNGMNFTENFWETNNALPLSENEERILQTLKSK